MTKVISPRNLRRHWIEGKEIALLDVREEGPYAEGHPLSALSVPVSELEVKLPPLVPRLSAPIVVYDDGEGYAERAVPRIHLLGYSSVKILEGGLSAYSRVGEVYRDVNVLSKAFGELVESIRHTPSLAAQDVNELLSSEKDVVVVDARRYEEFNTMSIPSGKTCPGGELVFRIQEAAPSEETLIIVNCAGRTRSIIGAQSLINAGIPNKVVALRNGTIGWTLADLEVDRGKTLRVPAPSENARLQAKANAERWANHVGVPIVNAEQLAKVRGEAETRTLYTFDVRDLEEYNQEHPAGFTSAPGGQLVQATDEWVGVRGARIVLYDNDGVRARIAASWLLQMGWDVSVLEDNFQPSQSCSESRQANNSIGLSDDLAITAAALRDLTDATVIDLARSLEYGKGHIPGSWFASGPALARDLKETPGKSILVLTSPDGRVAAANVKGAQATGSWEVRYLKGGTSAWISAGLPLETEGRYLSEPIDVYKRPYEGTDNAKANMKSYIDWELQLVAQLANDGIAGFHVVRAE